MFDYDINERITKLRKQKGLTKKDLAKMIGLKYTTYVRMEREGNINTYTLKKLAKILNVDVRILLYGEIPKTDLQTLWSSLLFVEGIDSVKNSQKVILGYVYKDIALTAMEKTIINQIRRLNKTKTQEVCDFIIKKSTR